MRDHRHRLRGPDTRWGVLLLNAALSWLLVWAVATGAVLALGAVSDVADASPLTFGLALLLTSVPGAVLVWCLHGAWPLRRGRPGLRRAAALTLLVGAALFAVAAQVWARLVPELGRWDRFAAAGGADTWTGVLLLVGAGAWLHTALLIAVPRRRVALGGVLRRPWSAGRMAAGVVLWAALGFLALVSAYGWLESVVAGEREGWVAQFWGIMTALGVLVWSVAAAPEVSHPGGGVPEGVAAHLEPGGHHDGSGGGHWGDAGGSGWGDAGGGDGGGGDGGGGGD